MLKVECSIFLKIFRRIEPFLASRIPPGVNAGSG